MNRTTEDAAESAMWAGLTNLALLSLFAGAVAGLVGAVFRLSLEQADRWRDALIAWAADEKLAGFLLVVGTCAGAAAVAAWLVRCFSPQAEGSGIPHVEAVMQAELQPAPFRLVPVNQAWRWVAKDQACKWERLLPT
jgi:CIC family chloride channel protein